MQARVLDGDDDLSRDDREQPLVGDVEPTRARGADRQDAEQVVAGQKRQADAAPDDLIGPHRRRDLLFQVVDDDPGARS